MSVRVSFEQELEELMSPFPTGKDGDPEFDYDTPREVIIRKALPKKMLRIETFLHPVSFKSGSGRMEERTLWDYEVDKEGNPLPGTDAGPAGEQGYRIRRVPKSPMDPTPMPQTRPLALMAEGAFLSLRLPYDKLYLKQLFATGRCANVSRIRGVSEAEMSHVKRDFYVEDRVAMSKRRRDRLISIQQATEKFRRIPADQHEALAIYFDIISEVGTIINAKQEEVVDEYDLAIKLEAFVREEPSEFAYEVESGDFLKKMLWRLCQYHSLVRPRNPTGYLFNPPRPAKEVFLGLHEDEAMHTLFGSEYERYRSYMYEATGFDKFAASYEKMSAGAPTKEEEIEQLRKELERERSARKSLEAKARVGAAVSGPGTKPSKAGVAPTKRGRGRPRKSAVPISAGSDQLSSQEGGNG